ncbi:hypothetical protein [Egbenema bharatensis]|uniref:hypothetical protein n=1 Tax=Egbenema bharatensis TaxID=3463334 RepID=UPI003A895C20
MSLTINPADAQAIQEDEAQLLSAIIQATRGAVAFLNQPQTSTPEPAETIRIQMGRRLVYGQMANGQFRNELDANTMRTIFDAIQRPVSEGVDLAKYRGKIPAIEVRDGGTILFREERDGAVSVNAIQFQLEQQATPTKTEEQSQAPLKSSLELSPKPSPEPTQATTQVEAPQESPKVDPPIVPVEQATTVAQTADYLLNPLREEQPIYDAVSVRGYQIKREGNDITIKRDDEPILVTSNGKVTVNTVTQQDWETFRDLQPRSTVAPTNQQNGKRPLVEAGVLNGDMIQHDILDAQQNKRNGIWTNTVPLNQDSLTYTADVVDAVEARKTQIQSTSPGQDTGSLTVDVAEATQNGHTLPAIAILERETAKLPDGATRQLLQTTAKDWKQQVQGTQQGVRQGLGWLASRLENWRHQQVARAALDLFNRGYERTGERSYQVGEFTVNFRGQNLYTLKDDKGELMRFQAFKSPIPGVSRHTIRVLSVSERLGSFQSKQLQGMQQNRALTPQGDLDVEATYNAKTNRVEQIVTHFLQSKVQANVWDKEGGKFKLEIGEAGFLRITDKQEGRGVVFQRKEGKVLSKLGARDFAHFDRLAAKMQPLEQQASPRPQAETKGRSRQKASGLELE